MNIEIGKKYKGKINKEIFEIIDINEKDNLIFYINKGKKSYYGLSAFKNCLLEEYNG